MDGSFVLYLGAVWPVAEVGTRPGTQWDGNIQEWGLEFSAPNPLGQPRQHDVRNTAAKRLRMR